MNPIRIDLKGANHIHYEGSPVKLGVPFERGSLLHQTELRLHDDDRELPIQTQVTEKWPDGSIRWVLLEFLAPPSDSSEKTAQIQNQEETIYKSLFLLRSNNNIASEQKDNLASITTMSEAEENHKEFDVTLSTAQSSPLELVKKDNQLLVSSGQSEINLVDSEGVNRLGRLNTSKYCGQSGPVQQTEQFSGQFSGINKTSTINYDVTVTHFAGSGTLRFDLTIHNPQAARHPDGIWDLGDQNSLLFKQLAFKIKLPNSFGNHKIYWRESPQDKWQDTNSPQLEIHQESSGGENWNSSNHVNRNNQVPLRFRGFRTSTLDGLVSQGYRASPNLCIVNTQGDTFNSCIENFWQNFPKALSVKDNELLVELFPANHGDLHELQGGERKTHTFYLNYGDGKGSLDWVHNPLHACLSAEYYTKTRAITQLTPSSDPEQRLASLIQYGINDNNNFFAKREVVDEYGWRNFGELYADHEAVEHEGDQPLISHYNNQYDPIKGFALQFCATGNTSYFKLMDQLAKHVADIDIYHCSQDRIEYNNGLFWHTDHYLDAFTSTHRTVSKFHSEDAYWNYEKGGGPGEEHCYSTGFKLHYYLTGSEQSKLAVLELANWIDNFHSGSGTLLELLKKFASEDRHKFISILRGETPSKLRHPLTRGTGNHIQTTLDAFEVTKNRDLLLKVEQIIKETAHPGEDINARALDDIENTWSYTVFLQSLISYLDVKRERQEFDASFSFAQKVLEQYANWMANHEITYLSRAETLEYPNDTWVAQEIRKACILYAAYYYLPDADLKLKMRADFFYDYCVDTLVNSEAKTQTRILAILMQNFGLKHYYSSLRQEQVQWSELRSSMQREVPPLSHWTLTSLASHCFKELFSRLLKLSPKKELQWLKFRSSKVQKLAARFSL